MCIRDRCYSSPYNSNCSIISSALITPSKALTVSSSISLKSYYYWLSKIRKLALEELPRKKNGIHMCTDQQSTALTESPAEFAELSLPDRNISRSTPAAILHIGSITVELYEGTSAQMLENILKAVQSC